jgi:repressor LexA
MKKLTETQEKLLAFIRSRHARTGIYPSVREIGKHMNFKSTNTVDYHLRRLTKAGVLVRRGHQARSFIIKGAKAAAAAAAGAARRAEDKGVPLLGRVAAGEPILAEQNFDGLVNFRNYFHCDDQTFALKVNGDSMIDAGIVDGDIVIVRQQARVENGEIGVAIVGDDATVKRIYEEGPNWRLQPENPAMKPIRVKKGEKLFRIAGKVIGVIRKI